MTTGSTSQHGRVPRSAAQLEWTWDDADGGKPPISARKLDVFERNWRQGLEIAASKCTTESCADKVFLFKAAFELLSETTLSCTKKCVSKRLNGKWVKVCEFSCKTPNRLSVSGWIR